MAVDRLADGGEVLGAAGLGKPLQSTAAAIASFKAEIPRAVLALVGKNPAKPASRTRRSIPA